MKCPSCGRTSDGKFCPDCGTPLHDAACPACSAPLPTGSRFCTQCGHQIGAAPGASPSGRRSPSNVAWYIAAAVLGVMVVLLLLPMLFGDDSDTTSQAASADAPFMGGSADGQPGPLSGNMRENADRLFNRIMAARQQGDQAEAERFYPMAIQAYQAAEPLDADGLYHLSLLQAASGDPAGARATAEQILDMAPNHLLGLGAAAEAANDAGDEAVARDYYQRYLDNLAAERDRELPEYLDHAQIFPQYELQARTLLGQ